MSEGNPNIRSVARGLAALAAGPTLADGPGPGGLTVEFMDWCDANPRPERDEAPRLAEACLSLVRIAGTSTDIHTVQSALQALVRAGRFGRTLCARLITAKTVPLVRLDPKVAAWPARDRLALAHEMLRHVPGDKDKETLAWLEELLKPIMATDPEELAPFVARLGEQGETLSFPARQILVSGLFGRWINSRLSNGIDGRGLEQLCGVIRGLGDSVYAEALAKAIDLKRIVPDRCVLRTIAAVSEAGNKTIMAVLLKILPTTSGSMAGACLDGLVAQDHPGMGKLLASVRTRLPGLRNAAVSRAPLLGDIGYVQYVASLPEEQQLDSHLETLGVLEAIAPDFARNITGKCPPKRPETFPAPPPPPPAEELSAKADKPGGFLKGLFRSKPKTLQEMLPKFRNVRDMELKASLVENEELDGRELTGLDLTGSTFSACGFIRGRIGASRLRETRFVRCVFSGTEFKDADFGRAEFHGCTFEGCAFTDCLFTEALLSGCILDGCRVRSTVFSEASLTNCTLDLTELTLCSLAGANLHGCAVRSCRFEVSDLAYSELVGDDFEGVEFINCFLHAMYIRESRLMSIEMPGTQVTRSIIKDSDAGHPQFLANRIRQMTLFAREVEKGEPPATGETDPFVAQKALTSWSRELTFMRRERRMLENNRLRMRRAQGGLTRDQQAFLRMLPVLLDSDAFERRFNFGNIPACRVWGFHPGLTALETVRDRLGVTPSSDPSPDVRILAVYAMGSLGTVAQTSESDLDCWVCYDGDVTMSMESGLKRKLDAISLWAESEFGLEAHFYPMRMDDVRDNRFLSGDEESSGSAQALLLKEEFYRTALKLAGKNIAWWITPAGAGRKVYDACIRAARRYPLCGKPRLEDFGYLSEVPPDEYFGGSLWQMVKAVRAPFKSVLKLGLLETYAAPEGSALPLCDRIKRSLTRNRQGRLDTDPYTALFSILHAYYLGRKETNAAALLKESFRLKANLSDIPFFMNLPARPEDESLISVLFGSGYVEPDRLAETNRSWPFEKSLRMGAHVRQYMVDTYQRIQSGLEGKGQTKALVNAEDLTRMGRRIAANFARKPDKILRVPFLDNRKHGFPILHFAAEKGPGKPPTWTVRGGERTGAKQAAENFQLLHRNQDPVHLLAWLLANRIYNPKSLLQADRSIAPIALADLQKFMGALNEFFPFEQTFERDINEGLQPERVTSAFFVLNLTAPSDTVRIEQAAVVYATNWGEMFCRTFTRPGQLFERNPSLFLSEKLEQPVPEPPRMAQFVPKGSQCKRIVLA
ncbi:MAG: class I adenylate cyclase [Pseudodesulfovibrio sp.]|uniref:class I adenylate cyclase n=1 Tax=Pseudodesulfovibrio sp. TaxID=2035812 RepID=UPI003D0CD53E